MIDLHCHILPGLDDGALGGLVRLGEIAMLAPHLGWIARAAPAAMIRGEDPDPPFPTE